jgi:hypothetical protein
MSEFDKELDSLKVHLGLNLVQGRWLETKVKRAVDKYVIGEQIVPGTPSTLNSSATKWLDYHEQHGQEKLQTEQRQSLWGKEAGDVS